MTKIFYDGVVLRVESDEYLEIKNLGSKPQVYDGSSGYPQT